MAYRKIAYYFVFVVWGVWFMQSSSWASELENRNSYCGVHVTKFMLRYYNVQADFVELVRDLNCRDSGIVSLDDIVRVLRQRGLRVSARNYESISELSKCLPCVVRMDQRDSTIGHFVVVVGCNSPVVSVWDGLQGVTVVPVSQVDSLFSGYAVTVDDCWLETLLVDIGLILCLFSGVFVLVGVALIRS